MVVLRGQIPGLRQSIFNDAQRQLVQALGRFLAVASNEGQGVAGVE